MFVQDILNLARLKLDDVVADAKGKYLWSDDELLLYCNQSERDLARRSRCLYDASTAAICSYAVYPGMPTLAIDRRVVEINAAYLTNSNRPLFRKTIKYFDTHIALWGWQSIGWRSVQEMPIFYIPNYEPNKIRFYPYYPLVYQGTTYGIQGISNITFTRITNTISKASGLSIFSVGDTVRVTGTLHNDGSYTVAAGSSDTALIVVEDIVNESNTSGYLLKSIDTLKLEVARLPLADVAIADVTTKSPEVDEDYHENLVLGILSLAYLKRDSETYNIQEATKFKGMWDDFVESVKTDQIIATESDEAFEPHYGSI